MKLTVVCCVALVLGVFASTCYAWPELHGPSIRPDFIQFQKWMEEGGHTLNGKESIPELRRKVLLRTKNFAEDHLVKNNGLLKTFGWVGNEIASIFSNVVSHPTSAMEEFIHSQLPRVQQSENEAEVSNIRRRLLAESGEKNDDTGDFHPFGLERFPYFRLIPPFIGKLRLNDTSDVTWSAPCFQNSRASLHDNHDGTLTVEFQVSNPTSLLCLDHYLLATPDGLMPVSFFFHGTHHVVWHIKSDMTEAEQWDFNTHGIRLFRFVDDPVQTIVDLIDTVSLFIPAELTAGISPEVSRRNVYFAEQYSQFKFAPRTAGFVPLNESDIHSGDFFGVVRMDGLDPMLAWAMGSTTGHTTAALWMDGELYVVESTVKDSYWPTDGIQRTPYRQWLKQAQAAGYNVVHAPLSQKYRSKFNATAAAEFFQTVEGFEYGYRNLLYGWVDTIKDNYPCLPPDYTQCLQWEHVDILFPLAYRLLPSIADMMYGQAMNNRLGTSGLSPLEVHYESTRRGIDPSELITQVERDEFVYNTTRWGKPAEGPSMVCCVFVCHLWKAAGLFDDLGGPVNCAELTNWDDYVLNIFNEDYDSRPEICRQKDPNNPTCQLMGEVELILNDYNTKSPYAHMAEHCPSLAPDYKKPEKC